MTPKQFFAFMKKNRAEMKMMDLKFVDLLGAWQHCSFPVNVLNENSFRDGLGFDGSSIRGWQGIHISDMPAIIDPDTACLDPFFSQPTVSVIANIVDPISRKEYTRDPRPAAEYRCIRPVRNPNESSFVVTIRPATAILLFRQS